MSELIQTGFDYAALPVDAALTARAAAERIKLRLKRTVEDIIEIGRELTAVKPSLEGRFDAWFESETGLERTAAYRFVGAFEKFGNGALHNATSFSPTVIYLLSAPSTPESVIDKAVAKAETGEKVTVADVKDWKADYESERQARLTAEQRAREFGEESNSRRKEIRELKMQVDMLKVAEKPEPVVQIQVVEKIPDDYEDAKARAAQLEAELAANKAEQGRIIQSAIKAKLQGYQGEVDALEAKKRNLERQAQEYQDYLSALTGETRQMEAQSRAFEKSRQALIDLASELTDFSPVSHELNCKALALAEMHENAAQSLRAVFNDDDGSSPAGIMRWFDEWHRLTGGGKQ